jgi:hypothetical protein
VHDDRGTIIVGWLAKLAIVLTVVGVLGFDMVSVAVTKVGAADDASNAARAGAVAYADSRGNVTTAYAAALAYAEQHDATIDPHDFVVQPDGTVTVKVVKTATTMVLYRSGTTRKWAHVVAEGSGRVA